MSRAGFLSLLMMCAPAATAAAADIVATAPPSVATGTTFEVPLRVDAGSSPLGSYHFQLEFDPALLTLESVLPAGLPQFRSQIFVRTGSATIGLSPLGGFNSEDRSSPIGLIAVATAVFRSGTAGSGSATITAAPILASDPEGEDLTIGRATSTVRIRFDVLPPRTALSASWPHLPGPPLLVSSSTALSLQAVDDSEAVGDELGLGVAQTQVAIDTTTFSLHQGTFSLVEDGTHTLRFFSVDAAGNIEAVRTSTVTVDATAPNTSLLANGLPVGATTLVLLPTDYFDLRAVDQFAGVRQSLYLLDGSTIATVHSSTFSLSIGTHTLTYWSIDFLENEETPRLVSITVLDPPPGPVTDLAAETGGRGGEVTLTWTAPGEDGYRGTIHAGRYLLQASEDPDTAFSTASAQVSYSTSTAPGTVERRVIEGLFGNTTHYVRLWTQDSAGGTSDLSNPTTAYALPNPPRGALLTVSSPTQIGVSWDDPRNQEPVGYLVSVSTVIGGPAVFSSPSLSSPTRSFDFSTLEPNTTYFFNGLGFNPETSASSPREPLGAAVTLAAPPEARPFSEITEHSATANWNSGANPSDTEFFVELSSTASRSPAIAASGWITGSSASFTGLEAGTTFYGQARARNRGGIETPFVDLGAFHTEVLDTLPPRTSLIVGSPNFGEFIGGVTPLSLEAQDDRAVTGDGRGSGVDRTLVAIDSAAFHVSVGTFSILTEGRHVVSYFSVDRGGRTEEVRRTAIVADLTAPRSEFQVFGSSSVVDGEIFIPTTSRFTINAVDPGTEDTVAGVAAILVLVDRTPEECGAGDKGLLALPRRTDRAAGTCENVLLSGTLALSPGSHTLRFLALDRVDNAEDLRTQAVTILPAPDISETKQVRFQFYIGTTPGPGQFSGSVSDVAVDREGNVYAADLLAARIRKYDPDGNFLLAWGEQGTEPGQFGAGRAPFGINISADPALDHLLAADFANRRVQIFTSTGGFLGIIGPNLGNSGKSLVFPTGVACDMAGNVYIADNSLDRIFKTDHEGNLLAEWAIPPAPVGDKPIWHVSVGPDGNVYATGGEEIVEFSPDGVLLRRYGVRGVFPFSIVHDVGDTRSIAFDAANNLYVGRGANDPVVVLSPSNSLITGFGKADPGRIAGPFGIAVNRRTGRIYVADFTFNRVSAFDVVVPTADIRSPVTSLQPLGQSTTSTDGVVIVSPTTPLSFSVTDSASPGVQPSGLSRTEYRLDGGPITVFLAPFTLGGGFADRRLEFRSVDRAGNQEAFKSTLLATDSMAPLSAVFVDGIRIAGGFDPPLAVPDGVVTTASRVTIIAQDPMTQRPAGVSSASVFMDGAAVALTSSSFRPWIAAKDRVFGSFDLPSFASEGTHSVTYQSNDRAGNSESYRTVSLDVGPAPVDPAKGGTFRPLAALDGLAAAEADVAVDAFGNIFLAGSWGGVYKFSPGGTYLGTVVTGNRGAGVGTDWELFQDADYVHLLLVARGASVDIFSTQGIPLGGLSGTSFGDAVDAAFDRDGSAYVADVGLRKIHRFGQNRQFTHSFGEGLFLQGPLRLATDLEGSVYALDRSPGRVLKFTASGVLEKEILVSSWSTLGGLAVDRYQNVYVSDMEQGLIHVFSSTGALIGTFGGAEAGGGQLFHPSGVDVHKYSGRVYTKEAGTSRIQPFIPDLAPGRIEDLRALRTLEGEIELRWTAAGADDRAGRATAYDVRVATYSLSTVAAFLDAPVVAALPAPQAPGSAERMIISGLLDATSYYFLIRAQDGFGSGSPLSNIASVLTPFVARSTIPLAGAFEVVATADQAVQVSRIPVPGTDATAVDSASIAQALVLAGNLYRVGPTAASYSPPATVVMRYSNDALSLLGLSESELAVFAYGESGSLIRLAQTLDTSRKTITAEVGIGGSILGVFGPAADRTPPLTQLAILTDRTFLGASGAVYVSSPGLFGFNAFDPIVRATSSGVAFTEARVDSGPLERITAAISLAEGPHKLEFRSTDREGNVELVRSSMVHVDGTPPRSRAQVLGSFRLFDSAIHTLDANEITITADDPTLAGSTTAGSGVKTTFFLLDQNPSACSFTGVTIPDPVPGAPQGTCANPRFETAFRLSPGSHTVAAFSVDNVGNIETPAPIAFVVTPSPPDPRKNPFFEFAFEFGGTGSSPGQFGAIQSVAADRSGNVYVGDSDRVQKFDRFGNFLLQWALGPDPVHGTVLPTGIHVVVDPAEHVWVIDANSLRVKQFSPSGELISSFGSAGIWASGITCDGSGNHYLWGRVPNTGLGMVAVFDSHGQFLRSWQTGGGAFTLVNGIASDSHDNIYVALHDRAAVRKFAPDGTLLAEWTPPAGVGGVIPAGLSVDAYDNVYASALYEKRILVFSSTGAFVSDIQTPGTIGSRGLAVSLGSGDVLIGDDAAHVIRVYRVDVTSPAAPILDSPRSGLKTASRAPLVVGQGEPGATIRISEKNLPLGEVTADSLSGRFVIKSQVPLGLGFHELAVTQMDRARNESISSLAPVSVRPQPEVSFVPGPIVTSVRADGGKVLVAETPTLVVGNFDADQHLDLMTLLSYGYVFARGDGEGGFVALNFIPESFGKSTEGEALAIDVDKDGFLDVLAHFKQTITVLRGNGDGTFKPPVRTGVPVFATRFTVSDLNRDPFADTAMTDSNGTPLILLTGNSDGSFALWKTLSIGAALGSPVRSADLDGDGSQDIIAGRTIFFGSDYVSSTTLVMPASIPYPNDTDVALSLLDSNQDGRPDIDIVVNDSMHSYLNLGERRFILVESSARNLATVVAQDLNSDGVDDIVGMQGPEAPAAIHLALGLGDGTRSESLTVSVADATSRPITRPRPVVTDLDGDSRPDILVPDLSSNYRIGRVLLNRTEPRDDIPPATIQLAAALEPGNVARLRWVAPGDDGEIGRATTYDLRWASAAISSLEAFLSATPIDTVSLPSVAGFPEIVTPSGLPSGVNLYFAIRAVDEAGNASAVSNSPALLIPFVATSTQTVSGAPELTFTVSNTQPSMVLLSTVSGPGATVLGAASGQGLMLVSHVYDLGPENVTFAPPAVLAIRYSTQTLEELGLLEDELAIYHFEPGTGWEKVSGQLIDRAGHHVSVPFDRVASIFALLGTIKDFTPPVSSVEVAQGSFTFADTGHLFISSSASLTFSAFDPVRPPTTTGVAFTEYMLDSATSFAKYSSPFSLTPGPHSVTFRSVDIAGNLETARLLSVFVDTAAPTVVIEEPRQGQRLVALGSSLQIRFFVTDSADASPSVESLLVQLEDRGTARESRPSSIAVSSGQVIGPLEIDDGLWELRVAATDHVGNQITAGSGLFEVVHDVFPPRTDLSVSSPMARGTNAAAIIVTRQTKLSITSIDDLTAPGDAVGLGSAFQSLVVDGVARSTFTNSAPARGQALSSTFSFTTDPDGSHVLAFFAGDSLGNLEEVRVASITIDNTAPDLAFSQPAASGFLNLATSSIQVAYADFGAGLDSASFALLLDYVDHTGHVSTGTASASFLPPVTVAQGVHTVTASISDRVGNRSTATLSFFMDTLQPVVSIERPSSGTLTADRAPPLQTTFRDSGSGLDVASIRLLLDGLRVPASVSHVVGSSATATFTPVPLGEGWHAITGLVSDRAGNLGRADASFAVDLTPPVVTFQSPFEGDRFIAVASSITVAFNVTDAFDPAPRSEARLRQVEDRGSPRGSRPAVVVTAGGQILDPMQLDDGLWQLDVLATDSVLNSTVAIGGVFEVLHDAQPPRTELAISTPHALGTDGEYVSGRTQLTLTSSDDLVEVGDGIGLGVASQRVLVDQVARSTFSHQTILPGAVVSSTLTLAADVDGLHQLTYYAVDTLGNAEVPRIATVAVDNTPPLTSLDLFGGRQFLGDGLSSFYASSDTRFVLAAIDPLVNGVAAGVAITRVQDNEGVFATGRSSFSLSEGRHALGYQSQDRLLNVEVLRSTTVLVDATPPVSTIHIGSPSYTGPAGSTFIGSRTPVTLEAMDPGLPEGEPGSGVDRIEFGVDQSSFTTHASTLTLAEGPHIVTFQAADRVGNRESLRTISLHSDDTAPSLTFAFDSNPVIRAPKDEPWFPGNLRIVWSATDAVSGVDFVEPDTLVTTEGSGLQFVGRTMDRVGNVAYATTTVNLDKTAPQVAAGEAFQVFEGQVAQFSSTVTDNLDDAVAFAWAFGDGGTAGHELQPTHVYANNGVFDAVLTATDHAGHVSSGSVRVSVLNAMPVVEAGQDQSAHEGTFVTLSSTFSDGGRLDVHTAIVEWGDGGISSAPVTEADGAGAIAASHVYADDGVYIVAVTITDNDGGVGQDRLTVTVDNVVPALASLPSLRAEEGSFIQLPPAAFTDPGFDSDPSGTHEDFTATIDWGDGTSEPAGDIALAETPGGEGSLTRGTIQAKHAYGDNGTYPVTMTVRDDDGGVATSTFTVTVDNVAPTQASLPSLRVYEGSFIQLPPAAFSDPGFDNPAGGTREDLTATIDWGDGTTEPAADITLLETPGGEGSLTRGTIQARHAYGDNGTYPVTVTVRDDDGGISTSTFTVTVDNVAPTLASLSSLSADEGRFIELPPAAFTDPGFENPVGGTREDFTATIDWGDGTTEPAVDITLLETPGGEGVLTRGTIQGRHAYGDNGTYSVTVTVRDDDGGVARSTFTVTVGNVVPALASLPALKTDEGSFIQIPPAAFTDLGFDNSAGGTREDFTATIDWGDGTTEPTADITLLETPGGEGVLTRGTIQGRHAYGDNGTYPVTVTVHDDDGGVATSTFTVTVNNTAPTLADLPTLKAEEGSFIQLPPAGFTDPGFDNPAGGTREDFIATIDWGDGTTEPAVDITLLETLGGEGSPTRGTIQARHAYGDNGTYPVTVTVRDDDGGITKSTFTVTVDNVVPALASLPSLRAEEGSFIQLPPAAFADPGFDNPAGGTREDYTATIDWGDGTTEPANDITLLETPGGEGSPTRGTIQARHAYGDNGTYPVTVTVRDDDGGVVRSTFSVTVDNVAPALASLPSLRAKEGSFIQLPPAAFTDPGFDNPAGGTREDYTATIDWGDGTTEPAGDITLLETPGGEGSPTRGTIQARHAYGDNGTYPVTVTVRDDDGGITKSTFTVTVDNVVPALASLPSLRAEEGSFIQLPPAAFTDPGFDNPAGETREDFTATIDWGDGTAEPAADIALVETSGGEGVLTRGTIRAKHAYGDNGSYPVTVTVRDDDGGVSKSTFTVTVDNVAPTLADLPSMRADEGRFIQLPAAFSDPGFDSSAGGSREDFAATIDWGDGTTEPLGDITLTKVPGGEGVPTRGTVDARHAYGDDGTYAVTVTVKDDDGGVATSTVRVSVSNVAPALASFPTLRAAEGSFIHLPPATFTDPGFDNPAGGTREDFTASIDWGDGTAEPAGDIELTKIAGAEGVSTKGRVQARHAYGDDGTYAVTVTVKDDDGGVTKSAFTVTVDNVAPTLATLPSLKTDEGSFIELPPATFTDPGFDNSLGGTREDFLASIDWGDGAAEPAGDITITETAGGEGRLTLGSIQARHAYGDNGTYAVTVTLNDDNGGVATSTFAVTVHNVAPMVEAGPDQATFEGTFISLAPATFTDPGFDYPSAGTGERFGATIDWGDGNTEPLVDIATAAVSGAEGRLTQGTVQAKHAYGDNGTYTVRTCVTDDDGGKGCSELQVAVENVAPIVDAGKDQIAAERGLIRIGGSVPARTISARVPGQTQLQALPFGPAEGVRVPPARYSDPGFDNPSGGTREDFAGTIAWGDGADTEEPQVLELEFPGREGLPSTGTLAAEHRYIANGIHLLNARALDDDAGQGASSFRVTVDVEAPISTISHHGNVSLDPGKPAEAAVFLDAAAQSELTAADPVINGVAFGVQWVFRRDPAFEGAGVPFLLSTGPFILGEEGLHRLEWFSVDNRGNEEDHRFQTVAVDTTPPATTLSIAAPQYRLADGTLLVSSRTPLSLPAGDPTSAGVASGLRETRYRVFDAPASTGAFSSHTGPFTLSGADVPKGIEFYSLDKVQNAEVVRSSTVLLDSQPPELAFHCPSEQDLGLCRVLRGRFPVLGTATDLHFREYRLEYAAGKDAVDGFALIQAGVAAVSSGTLGVWDASGFRGWQTLRLSASDQVDNSSVLKLNVWIGDPGTLMLLGSHDVFKMPEGVAVGPDGKIYVADRNNDRIAVFTSTGLLVGSFDGGSGGEKKESTTTVRLNKPSAVAVDGAGTIVVADTNNDRIIALSPSGTPLLALGRRNPSGNFQPGKDPGEFNKPTGLAVDRFGTIYVADSENRRVQVFSSSGVFIRQLPLPVATGANPAVDDSRGKPAGVAVDSLGRIYVTDSQRGRLITFSAEGGLINQLALPPGQPDSTTAPSGVAVSPSGDCVVVSDSHTGRILKFDRNGALNLSFGQKQKIDEKATTTIRLRKPLGLALDHEGNLYVADRNASQIKKFGLPSGAPTAVIPAPQPGDEYYVAKDVVTIEDGGTVERKDKAAVVIPIGAVPEDLQIAVSTPTSKKVVIADKDMKIVSVPVEFHPHGTQFASAVTLVIPYDSALVAAYKASEKGLQINYWNPDKNKWEQLVSVVDPVAKVVTAKTIHFSLYQVMAATGTPTDTSAAAADSTFAFRDLYVFPDPAVRGAIPTFHVAVGIADNVKLKVFDVAGRQVHSAALDRAPAIIDDGSGPKYAYEYAWRGHIPSGLYFYTMEADKGGHATIHKAGRFAVVR